jgi:hypothetical protein
LGPHRLVMLLQQEFCVQRNDFEAPEILDTHVRYGSNACFQTRFHHFRSSPESRRLLAPQQVTFRASGRRAI